ncbi:hypothetical protein NDU88_001762 [Pleurodeles waltl]|uniref:Uncharacterized protein n=1 Tax=Pleurodeles waltl TaxID=8319 RepID=A0AAV7UTP0_PLEWA|nr:hypothetical protein NDU88_001762 [Pleurodeles waltl]
MAPTASAAAPPFQAGHGVSPPGLRSYHQGGEAQQPRRAPQINRVVPSQAQSGSTASRGAAARQDHRGPPSQHRSSPLVNGAAGRAPHGPTAASRQPGRTMRAAPPSAQPNTGRAPALHRLPRQQAWRFTNREGPGPFTNASGRGERLQHA